MLKPLHDYVVLEKIKEEEKTQSGIILTKEPKDQPSRGIVVSVGPGKTENGTLVPVELKEGQKVIYKKYSGTEITEDKKDYLLIKAEDILAIVE
ncbi:MAG TPA: co-chaperone GroES [Erysipelotrichaceae bacterium]|nr:co-chaperone GroES [Erysipelotrichaceae bacterium]